MKKFVVFLIVNYSLIVVCLGNNIKVTQSTMTPPDTTKNYRMVSFNLSWDNSWRNDIEGEGYEEPFNLDAAWIFIKFKKKNQGWFHATLSSNKADHSCPNSAEILTVNDGKGIFIRRSSNGLGTNNWEDIQLRWNFAEDEVTNNTEIDGIKIFAIEMVYVPKGEFYVGDPDGANASLSSNFYKYGAGAYLIESEAAITVKDSIGYLWYDNDNNSGGDRGGPIPAIFPKGYDAYYCMKYEGTQSLFADFLNCLSSDAVNWYRGHIYNYDNRGRISISEPQGYYFVANRPDRVMPFMKISGWETVNQLQIILNWMGLRPMTELEYEKACRGAGQQPISMEFAWGNSTYSQATGLSGSENGTETATPSGANANLHFSGPGSDNYTRNLGSGDGGNGGLRAGIFARNSTTRSQAGATYYGILDMTGSLLELCVSIGTSQGRAYIPNHGNGSFSVPEGWPHWSTNGNHYQLRGGAWAYQNNGSGRIADRRINNSYNDYSFGDRRYPTYGIRGVRSAP